MDFLGIPLSADAWLAPVTAAAAMAAAAAVVLLRDHVRLERHAVALEAEMSRIRGEMRQLTGASERGQAILAAQRELIVVQDSDGRIAFVNDSLARFMQRPPNALIGSKDLPQPVWSNPPRVLPDGGSLIEEAYAGPDGERRVAWIETPVECSTRSGTLRVGRIIETASAEAEAAGENGLPRSFRAQLGGIVGLATLLLDTSLNGEQAIHARWIKALAAELIDRIEAVRQAAGEAPAHPARATAGKGMRVLLAEDDEMNGLFAIRSLELADTVVDWVRDGEEALARIEASFSGTAPAYDVVLMDLRMPRLDGLEAARRIRALEASIGRHEPLRIVAVTATTMRQDRLAAERAGISDFLAKPYSAQALVQRLAPPEEDLARAS